VRRGHYKRIVPAVIRFFVLIRRCAAQATGQADLKSPAKRVK
jgi:hypothetical protein